MRLHQRIFLTLPAVCLIAASCADSGGPTSGPDVGLTVAASRFDGFGGWSSPANMGFPVNSPTANTRSPGVSPDERSLYISSDRPGTLGDLDIWVSQRKNRNEEWGAPVSLGPVINTRFHDANPNFSPDGLLMFFNSNRPSTTASPACGNQDVWVSTRVDKHDDFGWTAPVNLGCTVNGPGVDQGPAYFFNKKTGETSLYYATDKPGAQGLRDIFVTVLGADGQWGAPTPVVELNSVFDEARPTIRADGLEIFFWSSNRPGGPGSFNVWVSTRASLDDSWSAPIGVFANMSLAGLSPRGNFIYLSGNRTVSGGFTDLFSAQRDRDDESGDEPED
jgi:Tol biopolymer transport system component